MQSGFSGDPGSARKVAPLAHTEANEATDDPAYGWGTKGADGPGQVMGSPLRCATLCPGMERRAEGLPAAASAATPAHASSSFPELLSESGLAFDPLVADIEYSTSFEHLERLDSLHRESDSARTVSFEPGGGQAFPRQRGT